MTDDRLRRIEDAIRTLQPVASRDGEAMLKAYYAARDEVARLRAIPDGEAHPWYGPCDGLGLGGGCSECQRVAEVMPKVDNYAASWSSAAAIAAAQPK